MTQEAFTFLSNFFSSVWKIFSSWFIPGTAITPAALLFLVPAFLLIKRVLYRLNNYSDDDTGDSK